MGRSMYYRHRTHYLIEKVAEKGIDVLLKRELIEEFGTSPAEAELLSLRSIRHLIHQKSIRLPNQIIVEARTGLTRYSKWGKPEAKKIIITPYAPEDLQLYKDYGLASLQAWRLVRVMREAERQDALLSRKFLGVLFNLSSGTLRAKLSTFTVLGIRLPFQGQAKKDRKHSFCELSTYVLNAFLNDGSMEKVIAHLKIPKSTSGEILLDFSQYCHQRNAGGSIEDCALGLSILEQTAREWECIRTSGAAEEGIRVLMKHNPSSALHPSVDSGEDYFREELKRDFGFSPAKARLWLERIAELVTAIGKEREDGEIIFPAVAIDESAGKPLSACRMVPVALKYLTEEDFSWNDPGKGKDDCVSPIKFGKMLRYTTAARYQGGVLTQGDLCYLLGIHTNCIRRLIKAHEQVVLPTRGNECDIGPGVTHKEKIVELYLQMYTETDIAQRTKHSYASIEQYIKDFSAVACLSEQGLNEVMLRKVMGCSMKLIKTYRALYERYNTKDYAFRLAQIRQLFTCHRDEYGGGKNMEISPWR
jgi:hypothetical protein